MRECLIGTCDWDTCLLYKQNILIMTFKIYNIYEFGIWIELSFDI